MEHRDAPSIAFNDQASEEMARRSLLHKKRQYAREYMRKWRSDPGHHQLEHESRRRCYRERKLRATADSQSATAKTNLQPVCGICRRRPSITEVVRLRMREKAPDGYVEVRIPYCGQC